MGFRLKKRTIRGDLVVCAYRGWKSIKKLHPAADRNRYAALFQRRTPAASVNPAAANAIVFNTGDSVVVV